MDLRDPWISNPFRQHLTQPAEYLDKRWERRCIFRADAVVVNTETALDTLRVRYGKEVGEKAICIPNGYDEEDFEGLAPQRLWPMDSRKTMLYAGSLYGPRSGAMLLDAFTSLARRGIAVPRLVILGSNDEKASRELQHRMEAAGMESDVLILPGVAKRQALSAMAASDVLVLIGDNMPAQLQVPSKLFEYLRIGKPILALYPKHSPVISYLDRYSTRYWHVSPEDTLGIERCIVDIGRIGGDESVDARRQENRVAPSPVSELSRGIQNRKLCELLQQISESKDQRA
jgi:glycosyltransferase involved in cell wall biosynthesis